MEGTAYKVWQTRSVSKGKTVGLIKLLDELEKVVAKGVALPFFSPGLVDRDRCLELIDLMRAALPEEVTAAQRIIAGEGEVLARAQEGAEEIRQRAEREAALMVEESQLTKMAEIRSQNIIQEGEKEAEKIVEAAENQAYRIFLKLEHTLDLLKAEAKEAMAAGFHPGSSEG